MSNAQLSTNKSAKLVADFKQIILELRAQNFDVIRFATYRTASKLRFIQKRLNLHLIDLWNVIEMFRDSNLHTLDIFSEIDSLKLEACIKNMYIQLNKRLAFNQQINVDMQTSHLLAWLLNLYDKSRLECIRVISFKVALTTLCAGKLIDKLKYIFTQISDQSKNMLNVVKFDHYLKELLVLPKSVFEEPSFGYTEDTAKSCFDLTQPVKLDDFLSVSMSDVAPACFIWLSIFHRFTIVQNITHPVTCSCCARSHFNGFRYKCQKCRKYQLCQDCFWRGRISHSHQLNHQMKEYTSYKSTAKQLSNTLRKSLFCKSHKQQSMQLPIQFTQQQQQQHHSSQSSKYKSINVQLDSLVNQSDYDLPIRNSTNESLVNANEHLNQKPMSTNDILGTMSSHTSQMTSSKKQVSSPTILNAQDGVHVQDQDTNHQTINHSTELNKMQPFTNTQSLSFSHGKKPNQSYSNTLSMTRSKQNNTNNEVNKKDTNNLLSAFISSANNNSKTNNDEHALIATCCARLSEFYAKHPHMTASSPSTAKNTNHIQSTFGQAHQQQQQALPVSSLIEAYNAKFQSNKKGSHNLDVNNNCATSGNGHVSFMPQENQRTNSLTRHLWYNTETSSRKYMNGGSPQHIDNSLFSNSTTTNSLSKTASRSGKGGGERQHGNIRSLSESNFRDNYDDEVQLPVTPLDRQALSVNQANAEFNSINERLLKEKREIVAKLEKQNREILKEIRRLKQKQQSNKSLDMDNCAVLDSSTSTKHLSLKCQQQMLKNKELTNRKISINPKLIAELMSLKERKGQLENRMQWLESSRDELIERLMQLDSLMKQQQPTQVVQTPSANLLNSKAQFIPCDVITNKYKYTPNSTINSKYTTLGMSTPTATSTGCCYVPQVSASHAMPLLHKTTATPSMASSHGQAGGTVRNVRSLSTPSSPALHDLYSRPLNFNATLNPVQLASNCSSLSRQSLYMDSQRNLKADLLIAADSVTNAMHNLVKELNSDNMSLNSPDEELPLDDVDTANLKLANGHVEHLNGLSMSEYAEFDNTNFYPQMHLNGKHNGENGFKASSNVVQSSFSTTPSLYQKDSNKLTKFTNAKSINGTANPITAEEHVEEDDEDDVDNFGPEENFENYFLNNKSTMNEFNYQKVVKPSINQQLNNNKLLNDLKYFDFNADLNVSSANREGEREEQQEEDQEVIAKSIDDQVAQWMRELEQRLDMNSIGHEQTVSKECANLNGFLNQEEFTEEHQEQTTTTTTTRTTITTTTACALPTTTSLANST